MKITARYPSRCASCGTPITVGDQIEWSKGRPARHIVCAATSAAPAPSRRHGGCHTGGNCSSLCNPSTCPCGDGGSWYTCC